MYRSKCLVKKCTDPNSWSKRVPFKILGQKVYRSKFLVNKCTVQNLDNQGDLIIVFSGVLWFILTSFFGSITDNNVSDVFRRGVDAYYFSEIHPLILNLAYSENESTDHARKMKKHTVE